MRTIRLLIVAGFALTAFGILFAITATSRSGADRGSGSMIVPHGDDRGAGLVLAQHQSPLLRAIAHPMAASHVAGDTTDPFVLTRLEAHKAILKAQGVTNLSALGTLTISGMVVPQPGFVRAAFVRNLDSLSGGADVSSTQRLSGDARPALKPSNMTTAPTTVQHARRFGGGVNNSPISGPAVKIIGELFVPPGQGMRGPDNQKTETSIPVNAAFWVANTINLQANTTIVVQPSVHYLVIIANSITVDANVTLTYEDVPVMNPPAVPGKPSTVPATPPTPSSYSAGTSGSTGSGGTAPLQIGTPPDAPQVEVWTLAINQLPMVNLKGQYGYKGVQGGPGGDGGRGGNGSDSDLDSFGFCKDGPASGGTGGKGGRGGHGGQGGNGGTGGVWSLYAPGAVILSLTNMTIDVSGGERGDGGDPGIGGPGGPGGSRGGNNGNCANTTSAGWAAQGKVDGAHGPGGDPDIKGPDGVAGSILPNSLNQVAINAADFTNKLTYPAIQHVYPEYPSPPATVGSTITIDGLNFTNTDTVTIGGVSVTPTFIADTKLQATVPDTWGSVVQVKVVRTGNTATSNTGAFYLKPVILSTVPASPSSRFRPGSTIVVQGTGFDHQMAVRVNGQDIASPVTPSSSQTLSFKMVRPASIPRDPANAAGEPAVLSVAGSGPIIESVSIPIVIATFQMLVIGDSVIWGEGLQQPDKFHTLVETQERILNPGISVYKTVAAHTGATLGWNDNGSAAARNGDIPATYPTIKQQAQELANLPNAGTMDLVLLDGCANDVQLKFVFDPTNTPNQIIGRVDQYCGTELTQFLQWLSGAFPVARIVVTGLYQGISQYSDAGPFLSVTGVMYGFENHQTLPPRLLAVSIGLSSASQPMMALNALTFANEANQQMANSVAVANLSANNRIFFADPKFGPQNAANASPGPAYVFGLSGGSPQPTDSLAAIHDREHACGKVYAKASADYIYCRLASTGHPDQAGAMKYFDAIKPYL